MTFPNLLKRRGIVFFMLMWTLFLGCAPQNAASMPVPSEVNGSPDNLSKEIYINMIEDALSQAHVKRQLERFGIKEDALRMHLADLNEAELRDLAIRTDSLKAGGTVGAVVAVILVIALIALIVYLFSTHDVEIRRK